MKKNWVFILAAIGVVVGLVCAYVVGVKQPTHAPVFAPVASPYASAIYANGIVESEQAHGENINMYPEIAGKVVKVQVREGQAVKAGDPLLSIDDSVQRATTEQLKSQAEAARTQLAALRAQPRQENLDVAQAQLIQAEQNLVTVRDQYDKRADAYHADPHSISRDVLDTARDSVDQANAAVLVAKRQYDLVKAGAWSFDITAQEKQFRAAQQTYQAAAALLDKYTVRAQEDGVVMVINAAPGTYVSSSGAYDNYTQGSAPVIVMAASQSQLQVRCFVDEILIARLPDPAHIQAQLAVRGSETRIPLEFVRIQPYVSPKIELSNQRQEKVDLRVLPVLFRFKNPATARLYPGEQVDVYIGTK